MKRRRALAGWAGLAAALAATGAASVAAADEVRPAGPWSTTIKAGPAIEASTDASTQVAVEIEVAHAIGDRATLGLAPQLQVAGDAMIVVPLAFQVDVRLPVEGLAVYPRIAAGLALVPAIDAAGFAIQPTLGVKYRIDERFHALLEPASFPMVFGDPVLLHARILAGAGASF